LGPYAIPGVLSGFCTRPESILKAPSQRYHCLAAHLQVTKTPRSCALNFHGLYGTRRARQLLAETLSLPDHVMDASFKPAERLVDELRIGRKPALGLQQHLVLLIERL